MMCCEVASLGSVCFTRWNILKKIELPCLSSPFDNIENLSQWQFDNIVEMLHDDFRQICPDDLKYREHEGTALDEHGNKRVFKGYAYTGKRLIQPVILAHFFDRTSSHEEGWDRWRHKCKGFKDALKDTGRRLVLVSLRLNRGDKKDTRERRAFIERSLKYMSMYLEDAFHRSPADLRILSIVAAGDADTVAVECDEPMYRQVVVPSGDEDDVDYWKRKPRQEYIDIAKDYIEEFNKEQKEN